MRIARIVSARVHRRGRCIDVDHDNEGLGARYVGVYPVRLGHQVGSWAQRTPPTGGVRLVHQVETEQFGMANEELYGVDERRIRAIAQSKVDESLDTAGERIELTDTAHVGQIEAGLGRHIVAARIEVLVGSIV